MSRIAPRVLSRLYPLCFLAAIGLVAFRHFDGRHTADGYLMGDAMVLCQLGLAGVLCRVLQALTRDPAGKSVRREAAQLLLQALDAMPEQPGEDLPRLRPVPRPASPSSISADGESARRPVA